MIARRRTVLLGCLLAWPLWAAAGPGVYQYTNLDLVGPLGRPLELVALTTGNTLAANEGGPGALSFRVSPERTLTPLTCPSFPRAASPSRGGPTVAAMNEALTVAGDDEHVSGASWGITITQEGTCTAYLYPGSVGTIFFGVSNAPGPVPAVVGIMFHALDTPGEDGLLRWHSFLKDSFGATLLDGPATNDRNLPTGWNTQRQVIGYAYRNIQPDNTYTYQGFLRQPNGTFEDLDTPTGQDFCPRTITDDGVIAGTEKPCGTEGGTAYLYDTVTKVWSALPLPTTDTMFLTPRDLTLTESLVGRYSRKIATGNPPPNDVRFEGHGVIGVPVDGAGASGGPPPVVPPLPPTRRSWAQLLMKLRARIQAQQALTGQRTTWRPVVTQTGQVVLTDDVRTVGEEPDSGHGRRRGR